MHWSNGLIELPDWLKTNISDITDQYLGNRLPHGLLILGHPGNGSLAFLEALAARLLCVESSIMPCGHCKSCLLVESGNHPDLFTIVPEGKSQTIKIDSIRQVNKKIFETSQQGGNKVVQILHTEKMNMSASNALLKILEEPTNNTYILMESSELGRILPTVRSRCRLITLNAPTQNQALIYLQDKSPTVDSTMALLMTDERPLDACSITQEQIVEWTEFEHLCLTTQSFIELSRQIHNRPIQVTLNQMLNWVDSALREQMGYKSKSGLLYKNILQMLSIMPNRSLFSFRDYIVVKLSAINRQANLNSQLMSEELASHWLSLRGIQ